MSNFPALAKAAAFNAGVILNRLDGGTTATKAEIDKACAAEGYADEMSIGIALDQLIDDGLVIASGQGASITYAKGY